MAEAAELAGARAALQALATLQEAGRVLSADNLALVRKIGDLARSLKHHPVQHQITELVEELVRRHEAALARLGAANAGATCPECGALLSPGEDLCPECGTYVGERSLAKQATEPASVQEREFSAEERKRLADEGKALPDGSFPIVTLQDLANAIQALGRASNPARAKRHIIKRARELNAIDRLPPDWGITEAQGKALQGTTGRIVEQLEAASDQPKGSRWLVRVIESGTSRNGRYWPPELLESPRFLEMLDGADIFEDHDSPLDAKQYPVRRVGEHVGVLRKPRAVRDGAKVAVEAEALVLDPVWRDKLLNAAELGELDRYQFSVNARGDDPLAIVDGQRVHKVTEVYAVASVDLVTKASAGGRFVAMLEADTNDTTEVDMTEEQLQALLAEAARRGAEQALANLKTTEATDSAVAPSDAAEGQAQAAPEQTAAAITEASTPAAQPVSTGATKDIEQLAARFRQLVETAERERALALAERMISAKLAEAKLQGLAAEKARARLEEILQRRAITEADCDSVIAEYRELAAAYSRRLPESLSSGVGLPMVTDMTTDREAYQLRLLAMLNATGSFPAPTDKDGRRVEPFRSLREAHWHWYQMTGDPYDYDMARSMATSLARSKYSSWVDHRRVQEALNSASWAEIVQDSLYVALLKNYDAAVVYDEWEQLVSLVEPVADFKARHWTRVGGYGDLPTVAEGAPYQVATSPQDEEAGSYTVSKRGFLEASITWELIANDQIGALARIPQELALAAKRTLYKFVFDLVTGQNPVMAYDSTALYDSSHGNTDTKALTIANLDAAIQAMESRSPRLASSHVLGAENTPKFLITSRALRARAKRILDPSDAYSYGLSYAVDDNGNIVAGTVPGAGTEYDPHHFKGSGLVHLVYQYAATAGVTYPWTNATDWYLVADPTKRDTVIVGFLGGRREPELFMQDDPNSGMGFEADVQAMKVRHVYGGMIVDDTPFYRNVSAA